MSEVDSMEWLRERGLVKIGEYMSFNPQGAFVTLDGNFTVKDLELITQALRELDKLSEEKEDETR
jgi:hypothetical protein